MSQKYFKHQGGELPLPIFFPDATKGFVKSLDSVDVANTGTPGVLVNTYHLWNELDGETLKTYGDVRKFMKWNGAVISDSGGFQIMSLVKKGVIKGKITDEGVVFYPGRNRKKVFTPEDSVRYQLELGTDLVVVLDDFTDPEVGRGGAQESVDRTIVWAERSKIEFEKVCKEKRYIDSERPYLIAVVQGGEYKDLRKECTQRLVEIGFDGLGWGGWPFVEGKLNFDSAQIIAENVPEDYLLYALGIGKPEDIVACFALGYTIFDCVLPTRDARHGRLCVWSDDFYTYFDAKAGKHSQDTNPVSLNCNCHLCTNYSRGYLYHLFKMKDPLTFRLASIHNLTFYSQLMEKLRVGEILLK